jgi:hypothetical protein
MCIRCMVAQTCAIRLLHFAHNHCEAHLTSPTSRTERLATPLPEKMGSMISAVTRQKRMLCGSRCQQLQGFGFRRRARCAAASSSVTFPGPRCLIPCSPAACSTPSRGRRELISEPEPQNRNLAWRAALTKKQPEWLASEEEWHRAWLPSSKWPPIEPSKHRNFCTLPKFQVSFGTTADITQRTTHKVLRLFKVESSFFEPQLSPPPSSAHEPRR